MKALTISTLLCLLVGTTAYASEPCRAALANQSAATGLPASLTDALATSLALGPDGRMYQYAVSVDGRTSIEQSPTAALSVTARALDRGAISVRVGCMGVEIARGSDTRLINQALDANWNVGHALGGISNVMSSDDIGAPLSALVNGEPSARSNTPPPPPVEDYAPVNRDVGRASDTRSKGSYGSTWGLFNDRDATPLSNP